MDNVELRVRELIKRHCVTYHVLPEWGADRSWHQQRTGFQVELHGVVDPEADASAGPPLDAHAICTSNGALEDIAAWAFGAGDDRVSVTIDPSRGRVIREPAMDAWVVELVGHVLHSGDVRRPVDDAEVHYLAAIKERLSSAGASER
jgi:hypothetical protein